MDIAHLSQIPLGILGTMSQTMTQAFLFVLDFAGTSYAETLGSGFIGFEFGHKNS